MEKNTVKETPIVLIGGSAGSLEVLVKALPFLKPVLLFPLVIILHRKNTDDNLLEELIAAKATVPVAECEDKTQLEKGCIYVAPPDYHLLFEGNGEIGLDVSEKVNYSRPSIDVSFQSAACVYGGGVTAILLSGANSDGTEGLRAIQNAGGKVAIQNPDTAEMPYMPRFALNTLNPYALVTPDDLAQFINGL